MPSDPTLAARLLEFAGLVILNWYFWVAGVVLVIDQLLEHFSSDRLPTWSKRLLNKWPLGKDWISTHWPHEQRRRITLIWLCIVGFFIASFQAYDGVKSKLVTIQSQKTTQLSRKMADDLAIRIKAAGPGFITSLNQITIAFTCGSGAQQFADDFMQVLESSRVNAGRLVFCTANTEIETDGLYMTVPDPEHLTDTAKELFRVIRDSLIPVALHQMQDSELKGKPQSISFIYVGK